jgi:hypothetical protein
MLRDEYGMPSPGRLPAIVQRLGWREPLRDQVAGVLSNDVETAAIQIRLILWTKPEFRPEGRGRKLRENAVQVAHSDTRTKRAGGSLPRPID